jgi:outer membrane protein TolC
MRSVLHFTIICLYLISPRLNVSGQSTDIAKSSLPGDSLTLTQILQTVMQSHPSIKEAEEALNEADARIGLAKTGYYPNLDANASYTRLGPAPTITFPGLGSFQLYPNDNYSASLNYEQTLYDFGKTSKTVKLAKESKTLTSQSVDLIKQRLTLLTIQTYYSLVLLQEAIGIKNLQIETLKNHSQFIGKKKATGSATQYELLMTNVRISNSESQKLDLETMQRIQRSVLGSLIGAANNEINVKKDLGVTSYELPKDSLLTFAFNHRIEMAMAKEKETLAGLQYQMVKSQNNPRLNIFASGGWKNGYIPDLSVPKANYAAGVGLKVPILNGNRLKNNLLLAKSTIQNTTFETEIAKRNISNEVVENKANCDASKQKINQFELQLSQAEEAFALANVSFKAGTITNLDLLDAETSVSESRLSLLRSKIEYILSIYKLNIALGNKMY